MPSPPWPGRSVCAHTDLHYTADQDRNRRSTMWISFLIGRWRRSHRRARRKQLSAALHLECLDDRVLPSFLPPISTPDLGAVYAVADFNNDHIADVVSANSTYTALTLRLGVGDGTFRPPVTLSVPI